MTGFEPQTSGIGSDRSTNWATQPLPTQIFSYAMTLKSATIHIYGMRVYRKSSGQVVEKKEGLEWILELSMFLSHF